MPEKPASTARQVLQGQKDALRRAGCFRQRNMEPEKGAEMALSISIPFRFKECCGEEGQGSKLGLEAANSRLCQAVSPLYDTSVAPAQA